MKVKKQKVSPRQKMINLMYVLLMAMLAMNVSSDVLNGFTLVDESLTRSTENAGVQNNMLYSSLGEMMEKNPEKVREWYERANSVKAKSDSLYKPTAAEAALKELYDDTDYSISILYADAAEMCIAVYPDIIKDSVGKDLSIYGTDEEYYAGREIALTNYQLLESGFYSSVLSMPLYENGKFSGYKMAWTKRLPA